MNFGSVIRGPLIRRSPRPNLPRGRYGTPLVYQLDAMGRVVPKVLPPGWHNVRVRVHMRLATCREDDCDAEPGTCRDLHKLPDGDPIYLYDLNFGGEIITRAVTQTQFIDELYANTVAAADRLRGG